MAKQLVCVVIPVYKSELSKTEIASLTQCVKILSGYPISFVGPKNLDITAYQNICGATQVMNFVSFDEHYFNSISGYNSLMLSPSFYKAFLSFKYILVHQLDAYVFKDELKLWCKKTYDYIGAPHTPHLNQATEMQFLKGYQHLLNIINRFLGTDLKIKNVGNGGFSLRRTRSCYWLLRLLKKQVKSWGDNNEDGFFKYWGNLLWPFFKLPTDEIALHFAIEQNPASAIQTLNGTLPFGCHAFEKFGPEIWQKYIRAMMPCNEN